MVRRRPRFRCRCTERLEPRRCLSTVTFVETVIDEPEGLTSTAIQVGNFLASSEMEILALQRRGGLNAYSDLDATTPVNDRFELALPDNRAFAWSLAAADVNGDGKGDLIVRLPELVWYPHLEDDNQLSEPRLIDENGFGREILVVDLDGDDDLDLMSGSRSYRNVDGQGTFEVLGEVTDPVMDFEALGDIDGDGDVDVAARAGNGVAWCRNSDGFQTIDDCTVIESGFDNLSDLELMDVDGDGDNDIVIAQHWLSWMENSDGLGDFLPSRRLVEDLRQVQYVAQADMDQDGRPDLLFTESESTGWFPMTDSGLSGTPQMISTSGYTRSRGATHVADVDGDSDLDVAVARQNNIAWYENRVVGDSTDDGIFDSSDLVAVLAAGKYERGIESNATYDDGDWNQDGKFDSEDLIFAFAAGHYDSGAGPLASDVAAAVDALFTQDEVVKPAGFTDALL